MSAGRLAQGTVRAMDAADVARTTGPANRAQCNGNNWHPQSKCHKRPCESPEFFSVPVTSSPSLSVCWVNHRPTSRRAGGSRASLTLLGPDPCIRMRNQRKGPVTCRPTGSVGQRDPGGDAAEAAAGRTSSGWSRVSTAGGAGRHLPGSSVWQLGKHSCCAPRLPAGPRPPTTNRQSQMII